MYHVRGSMSNRLIIDVNEAAEQQSQKPQFLVNQSRPADDHTSFELCYLPPPSLGVAYLPDHQDS